MAVGTDERNSCRASFGRENDLCKTPRDPADPPIPHWGPAAPKPPAGAPPAPLRGTVVAFRQNLNMAFGHATPSLIWTWIHPCKKSLGLRVAFSMNLTI
eukprot:sb/3478802/